MADHRVSRTSTTSMNTRVNDYSVTHETIDSPTKQGNNTWDSPNWHEYLGYYKQIPELKKAIDALAIWTVGKGFETDSRTKAILDNISGSGEDSFQSILWNLIVTKKVNGDAFAEIIRNEQGTLINLKPLNPSSLRIVVSKMGIIEKYEELDHTSKVKQTYQPQDIFHISNDRVANEMHGISVVEACKWVIDARNEAMADWRRILHRNLAGVRIIEVDEDDTSKLNILKTQWENAINKGEVLILPKGTAQTSDAGGIQNPENWIRYLEGFFYQAVGIPKVIASSEGFNEASSKIGYLVFEPIYTNEQTLLEQDLWNQLAIKVKFNRPPSLGGMMQEEQSQNQNQTGIQPNEVQATISRNE